MRDLVKVFPKANPEGTPLGYEDLTEEEVTHLKGLGYDVQHYRSATGPRLIELYMEGCIKGLIKFDKHLYGLLESSRKQFSKVTKEQAEAGLVDKGEKVDAIKLLEGLGSQSTITEEAPKRGRGRPPKHG